MDSISSEYVWHFHLAHLVVAVLSLEFGKRLCAYKFKDNKFHGRDVRTFLGQIATALGTAFLIESISLMDTRIKASCLYHMVSSCFIILSVFLYYDFRYPPNELLPYGMWRLGSIFIIACIFDFEKSIPLQNFFYYTGVQMSTYGAAMCTMGLWEQYSSFVQQPQAFEYNSKKRRRKKHK